MPTLVPATLPDLNRIIVGMPWTRYFVGACGFSSILTLATVSLPALSAARSSRKGAIILHGPHHSAQKSTRTGPSALSTSVSKLLSVTAVGFIASFLSLKFGCDIRCGKKAASRQVPCKPLGADRHQQRPLRPQEGAADVAARIDAGQRRAIDRQLAQVDRRHLGFVRRHLAQGLVIDDQHI